MRHRDKCEYEAKLEVEVSNRQEVERNVASLTSWLKKMSAELKMTKHEAESALQQKSNASDLATRRLQLLRNMKAELNECSDKGEHVLYHSNVVQCL